MKQAALVGLIVVVVLLQVSFLAAVRPFGVVPDIALITVILVGLSTNVSQALIVGLATGLLLDIASGSDFGLRTGLFLLAALVTGVVRRSGLLFGGPLMALILVAAATLIQTAIILVNLANIAGSWPVGFIVRTFVVELMVNLGLTLLLRPLIRALTPPESTLPVIE